MNSGRKILVAACSLAAAVAITGCSFSASTGGDPANSDVPTAEYNFGDGTVTTGKLPDNWPSDVPTPDGLEVYGVAEVAAGITATFKGPGDLATVTAQEEAALEQAGWTKQDGFGGGGAGSVTVWKKGNQEVSTIFSTEGGEVVAVITAKT